MQTWDKYANDITEGRILACKWVKLACQRHLTDLKEGAARGLHFDETAATRAINFIQLLRHIKGKWANEKKTITLEPWQQFIIANIFGWKKANGKRRFRYGYTEVPRKNGKTALAAGIANYMLVADNESGSEVYTAATTRDQAKECFTAAKAMMKKLRLDSPKMGKLVTVYEHNVHILSNSSKMEAVSSDADTLDGKNPHCAIIDEYHAHKTDDVYNVMKSGMGAREQPLQFTITTAGFNKLSPCYALRKNCLDLLEGIKEDDSTFCIIYTLDKEDEEDWSNPLNWSKANPNYGVSVYPDYIKEECTQAINMPSQQVNFLTKNLNVWTDAAEVWIPDTKWMAGAEESPDLAGRTFYGGLDLASTSDITAFVKLFPPTEEDGLYDVVCRFWIPEETVYHRSKKDGVPYLEWMRQGYIEATPGNVTDYAYIRHAILEDCESFNAAKIAYDRWNSSQLVNELVDEGLPMSPFGQGFASMSAPTKQIERLALMGKLRHGGNPVLRWMCRNVEIQRNPAGDLKMDKGKSKEKIDGMIGLAMCMGEYLLNPDSGSIYDERDIRFI
jgi:phage terminase large subunit-like protein